MITLIKDQISVRAFGIIGGGALLGSVGVVGALGSLPVLPMGGLAATLGN